MTQQQHGSSTATQEHHPKVFGKKLAETAVQFTQQAEKLSHQHPTGEDPGVAIEAQFVTPHDPVIITSDGKRLPGVPLQEAHKLNVLREELQGEPESVEIKAGNETKEKISNVENANPEQKKQQHIAKTNTPFSYQSSLFPPLPLYGPPNMLRNLQCMFFRISAFFLSLAFLGVIVLGSLFTTIPMIWKNIWYRLTFRDPDSDRPFYEEEKRRAQARREQEKSWKQKSPNGRTLDRMENAEEFPPTEGGPDPIICDVAYYARRVGLDVETFEVQTEDGFIIDLWHVYDPQRVYRIGGKLEKPKFPVLLMHGLLQSSGAYCCNDDDSLAFWLCKSGYDVWLGNNRCGFKPKHALLEYNDPRMWCWNIRQMGVFDLPALTSRVITETGFEKIGLICHSQAAYAGPLIGKMYFKFMRIISPGLFRLMFGIHAFIPFMMQMHKLLDPRLYGWLGYKVFSFLFDWTDARWDRGLRNRMFQFAPVYVSAESMRWWLGRECFAKHKCILSTKEIVRAEEHMDSKGDGRPVTPRTSSALEAHRKHPKGSTAWYNKQAPPMAMWVCGNDDLVDGRKLLRRFEKGREPHVNLVHSKVIPEYEHLDVIWAMDAVDQVFKEVREVLWKTCNARDICRVPEGCEAVLPEKEKLSVKEDVVEECQSSSSGET
ncbi:AB-hydrolase lipase domain [Fusarium oxysporum f. sp. vasinfectum]|nr:AB-hydrolase lipase domain [Fusarium oxysporum f. sp. vasinfectum]